MGDGSWQLGMIVLMTSKLIRHDFLWIPVHTNRGQSAQWQQLTKGCNWHRKWLSPAVRANLHQQQENPSR